MTDRMGDEQLDREIRAFLTWQAEEIAEAPTAAEMASRISSRAGTRTMSPRVAPRLVWVVLTGLLIVALLGALLIGATLLRHDALPLSYEAVFLRLEVVDRSPEVVVVGVNAGGRERQVARLRGAWVSYPIDGGQLLAPMGAISPHGLLAIPTGSPSRMQWEIVDLNRPGAEPIVIAGIEQDVEQLQPTPFFRFDMRPSVFWGPEEHLAIPWYERPSMNWHLSFVDGHTGAATAVDYPGAMRMLPAWAPDGSGVIVTDDSDDIKSGRVLHPDGSVTEGQTTDADSSCRTHTASGAEIKVSAGRIVQQNPDGSSLELPRPRPPAVVAYACLAPDDWMIVDDIDIGASQGYATAAHPKGGLIAPGSGTRIEIEGSFAGWLEVLP